MSLQLTEMSDVIRKDGVVVGDLVVLTEFQDDRKTDAARRVLIVAVRVACIHVRGDVDGLVDNPDRWICIEVSSQATPDYK